MVPGGEVGWVVEVEVVVEVEQGLEQEEVEREGMRG